MLHIVRGNFPAELFDGRPDDVGCKAPISDAKTLSCMWSEAMSNLSFDSVGDADTLRKLQRVCGITYAMRRR